MEHLLLPNIGAYVSHVFHASTSIVGLVVGRQGAGNQTVHQIEIAHGLMTEQTAVHLHNSGYPTSTAAAAGYTIIPTKESHTRAKETSRWLDSGQLPRWLERGYELWRGAVRGMVSGGGGRSSEGEGSEKGREAEKGKEGEK